MKERESFLEKVVVEHYGKSNLSLKRDEFDLTDKQRVTLQTVYHSLDGKLNKPPLGFGAFDIQTPRFIIELDEEQHFNRYRLLTLENGLYNSNINFDVMAYKSFCNEFENNCLNKASRGKYWTSPSTVKQFGDGSTPGDLRDTGSPRWKQRAFYDFCRDFFGSVFQFPVIRFSIYENVNGSSINLGKLLQLKSCDLVLKHVEQKLRNYDIA